jgi:hypothetical protein
MAWPHIRTSTHLVYEQAVAEALRWLTKAAGKWARDNTNPANAEEVLREILNLLSNQGIPFQLPWRAIIEPAWLSWNRSLLVRLVQALAEERAFDRLPILGDALEEAGCTDDALLAHCRQGEPHLRRCLVLDLLRQKGASSLCFLPRQGASGVEGLRYRRTVEEAVQVLNQAAEGWAEGDPGEPSPEEVLHRLLAPFLQEKFLRRPFGQ